MKKILKHVNNVKTKVAVAIFSFAIAATVFTESAEAVVPTESTVTREMCAPTYWNTRTGEQSGALLMDPNKVSLFNSAALKSPTANMNDITGMDASYDAGELKVKLANSIASEIPQKPIFVNGVETDTDLYYRSIAGMIAVPQDSWSGIISPKYAVAVSQTQIKSLPTADYIGYSAEDSDDEVILSSLRVNEPFLVKAYVKINGHEFYWGYSKTVSGWVLGDDIAFCEDKAQWLDMWQTDVFGKDFIVVTTDEFALSESHYLPATSGVKLTMGTTLKLVPDSEVPRNIGTRGAWNNYVVYLPTRGEDGKMIKQVALVSQGKDVNIGYLPMTSANLVNLSFKYLGNTYGWGGMLDSVDCSAYVGNVYKCFGLDMPRNTSWQREVPGTCRNIGDLDDAAKADVISKCIPGTPLYFSGHTMIYLGTVDGTSYVISALGSVVDSNGYEDVQPVNSVAITPLTVKRKNGTTWLQNIDAIVEPWTL